MLGKMFAVISASMIGIAAFATTTNTPGIKASAHNFSGGFTDEICIYCHTPHGSNTTVTEAPLWNHTLSTSTAYVPYTSGTMNAVPGQPNGISKLCLSCHDGTVSIDSYGGSAAPAHLMTGGVLIGLDLKNDHPISFVYDAALIAADGKLNPLTTAIPVGINSVVGTVGAKLLDAQSRVQCTSCHDAHNAQGLKNILKVNNTGSNLCLSCHKI